MGLFDFDDPLYFNNFSGQKTRDGVVADIAKKPLPLDDLYERFCRICVEYEDSETDCSSFDGETYLLDRNDFNPHLVSPEKSPMLISEQLEEDEEDDEWESLNILLLATVLGEVAAADQQKPETSDNDGDKKVEETRLGSTIQGQTYKLFVDKFDNVTPTDIFLENLHACARKMAQ